MWAHALYGGEVLAPAYLTAMVDVRRTAAAKSAIPYGYGVQALEIDGRPSVGHSGRLLGFRSAVRYLPDQGIAIAVLTNQSRADPAPIVRSLLRLALTPRDTACRCRRAPLTVLVRRGTGRRPSTHRRLVVPRAAGRTHGWASLAGPACRSESTPTSPRESRRACSRARATSATRSSRPASCRSHGVQWQRIRRDGAPGRRHVDPQRRRAHRRLRRRSERRRSTPSGTASGSRSARTRSKARCRPCPGSTRAAP